VAIVTGAGSGIGEATAQLFAEQGAAVTVGDISREGAERVAASIQKHGGRAVATHTDVTRSGEVRAMVGATVEAFGGVDILVNNAGAELTDSVVTISETDWDRVMDVNVKGGFLCSKYAIPEMRKRGGGAILFTASTFGLVASTAQVAYCASKAAIVNIVRSMALDHAPHNIRVNCVCPGPTRTPMAMATIDQMGADVAQHLLKTLVPYGGRLAEPREIASVFLFLASEEASFVTGCALVADGGQIAGRFIPELVQP
jgi:NAD(P)-dependent dehydrogenase (short-subunit alcohol dehydrogenase family)